MSKEHFVNLKRQKGKKAKTKTLGNKKKYFEYTFIERNDYH